jgi:hypothetical protein
MIAYTPKPKTCAMCPREFLPRASFATCCGPVCARKKVEADKKALRAQVKTRRMALETIPELIAAAQKEFNAYCRERDRQAGYVCISSGRALDWTGNAVDAGHYRSIGAAAHLRFNEDNCHAQSKHDNRHLAGNAIDYRLGLIARIGLARVEALESDNEVRKWDRDELRAIRATYKAKTKQLKAKT